jgi:putative transposase
VLKPAPGNLGTASWTPSSTHRRRSQARSSPGLEITSESLNYQLRKIIKNRGHFPSDDAVIKLLWLAIRDIEDKRARARAKEKGIPKAHRKASGRLVEGAVTQGWRPALAALLVAYPDRLAQHIR